MPQLDPTWFASQLFWLFVSFVLLYLVLSRVVLPPLLGIMAERKTTMDGDVARAQVLTDEAEKARKQYEHALAEAREKSQQLIDTAMLEHKQKSEQANKALDEKIAGQIKEAQRKIAAGKQELMEALTPATAEMTALIVEKLTQHSPGDDKVLSIFSKLSKGRG